MILKNIWKNRGLYLFLIPSLILVIIWAYIPIINSITLSFFKWKYPTLTDPRGYRVFNGLNNFIKLFTDEKFWYSYRNWLKAFSVILFSYLVPPLIAANIVFHLKTEKRRYFFRTLFVAQLVVPTVVVFLIWHFMYSSTGP
ncbi:MAG: hypothetical protein AB1798_18965, partial [Spirochaetota bacterium]